MSVLVIGEKSGTITIALLSKKDIGEGRGATLLKTSSQREEFRELVLVRDDHWFDVFLCSLAL